MLGWVPHNRIHQSLRYIGEQAAVLAGLQHLVQEEPFGPASRQSAAELGEDGEVETVVVELQSEGVLPVDAAADGVGGLAPTEPRAGRLAQACELPSMVQTLREPGPPCG